MWFYFVLAGFFGGLIGGMGMGGGTLLIPILTIFLGLEQHIAQGLNLLVFIPTAVIAVLIHAKNKLIDYRLFFYIILPAICSSILFSFLSNNTSEQVLKYVFGGFLIVLGLIMLILAFVNYKNNKKLTYRMGI